MNSFRPYKKENKHIITMEWIVEGVALIAVAAFVAVVTAIQSDALAAQAVYIVAMVTLIALAVVSIFTGFKVPFLPFKLCPFIFCTSALLIYLGGWR